MLHKAKDCTIETILGKRSDDTRYQSKKSKREFIMDKWSGSYFVYKKLGQKKR